MEIRPACGCDLAAIAALYVGNHRETYAGLLGEAYLQTLTADGAENLWRQFLADGNNCLSAAYEGGALLGFAAGRCDPELPGTWYLESLHAAPGARGNGVGTALIRSMAKHAAGLGYRRMSVCIVRGNEGARRLYTRLGAAHLHFFDDDFHGTVSHSEKLIWQELPVI